MEDWEKDIEEYIKNLVYLRLDPEGYKLEMIHLKNFIQKQKVMAKIKENHAWCRYFQSKEVNLPDMVKHFAAMNMKLQSLLTRFP